MSAIDFYDPRRELEVRLEAAWRDADDWAAYARRYRADALRYYADIWRRRQTWIGPIDRRLWDPDFGAWKLVLNALDQRAFAILKTRRAIRYALEVEAELERFTAANLSAGCASGAVRFSGEGPEPRTSETSVRGTGVLCRDAGASLEVER